MTHGVNSVAVVGRDASLWLTAAALQRALGRTGLRVQAVELESHLSQVDAYAALPTLGSLHRLLGLDEALVLNVCRGVPMVGQRFSDWAKGAPPYLLGYDDEPAAEGVSFTQYWAKAALEGLRVGLEDFSLGSACARLNVVPVPGDEPGPVSASYGYHLDAPAYAELAKQLALKLGVEVVGTAVRQIDVSGDMIAGIDLADGTRLAADLYVDASGREAVLLGRLAGAQFESWSDWLPCDRLLVASGPRLPRLPAFSQISAFDGGWVGLFPLQDRTAITAVYDSGTVKESEIVQLASVVARTPISGDAVISALKPGRQRSPWIGNCVAIGQAAVAVDPIDAAELQVTHGCISHLVTLFPATAGEFPEAAAYNSAIACFGDNLRDFQAAHYVLNRRFDERMWDRVRDAGPPPSLARKIDMFSARALVPLNDHETFQEQGWASLLVGCGVRPQGYDPRVDSVPANIHVQQVQQRLRDVATAARRMPQVEQFLQAESLAEGQVL